VIAPRAAEGTDALAARGASSCKPLFGGTRA